MVKKRIGGGVYWLGILGTWIIADGVASLWSYTRPEVRGTQSWLRDHSLRCLRIIVGIIIITIGALA